MSVYEINETHNLNISSWVDSAQIKDSDFPIQNLPLGITRAHGASWEPHVSVAIGDKVLDLFVCSKAGLFPMLSAPTQEALCTPTLNFLMSLSFKEWSLLRRAVHQLLRMENGTLRDNVNLRSRALRLQADSENLLPAQIGDYTDFYASMYHARNVGKMFRPDNPLLPNYKHMPIAYHGRSSSIVISGTNIRRPCGQVSSNDAGPPQLAPTQLLDYETELGFFIGKGSKLGQAIRIDAAEEYVFGVCLLNDWSARDIQKWEYQPLGPFLGKNFATSISPWIVTMEALLPYRVGVAPREAEDPQPLSYLLQEEDQSGGALDISVQTYLLSKAMSETGMSPVLLGEGKARTLYWTSSQFVAHHTVNGCNLRPGDLMGSGTISGPEKDARGCLLELTWRGSEPLHLPSGEMRKFLADGDEVIMHGKCVRNGFATIGFGECRGRVVSSP